MSETTLNCEWSDCPWVSHKASVDLCLRLLEIHITANHTSAVQPDTRPFQPAEPEKAKRPVLASEISDEDWKYFLSRWACIGLYLVQKWSLLFCVKRRFLGLYSTCHPWNGPTYPLVESTFSLGKLLRVSGQGPGTWYICVCASVQYCTVPCSLQICTVL